MNIETFIQKLREMEARYGDEILTEASEPEEDPAEEIQHHTSLIFACKLPGVIHSNLIPWYTSGFQ